MIQIFMQAENTPPEPAQADGEGWVLPAKQARSRRLRDRILAAGNTLIEERNFNDVTIADIAAMADCSTGAFYYRFKDKQAFFHGIVDRTIAGIRAELDRRFDAAATAELSETALTEAMVAFVVGAFRDHGGLIRAGYVFALNNNLAPWQPIRELGGEINDVFVALLIARVAKARREARDHDVRVAMQMIYGTLLNAVVNMPGPVQVGDDEMIRRLAHAFRANLDFQHAP